jgi:very-short-patch-repair endonuclease
MTEQSSLSGACRRSIPPVLMQRVLELRQRQTPAELVLWECLRARRLCNAKFRRQHNIGRFIADFYCHAAALVVEVDGEVHDRQQEADGLRDAWMRKRGLTVLRFRNDAVFEDLEGVLEEIAGYLELGEEEARVLSPGPSPEGAG